jgi:hypothetical protein
LSKKQNSGAAAVKSSSVVLFPQPALQLIYDTAPIGLACLSPIAVIYRSISASPRSRMLIDAPTVSQLSHVISSSVKNPDFRLE